MNIVINGENVETKNEDLVALLIELGYGTAKVATALNEEFIPASSRSDINLKSGDRLEILAPMQGG
jgi:sulfur carrier protein